jgi:hypothetical protein
MPKRDEPTPPEDSTQPGDTPAGEVSERGSFDPGPIDQADPFVRCKVDPAIERHRIGGFRFPLGVYPVEELGPKPGYTLDFESADGGDEEAGEWEEWPDRYVFDAVLTIERVPNLVRCLLSMMPPKVFPILDVLGHDAFREIDPYVAYDTVGLDRVIEALKQVPAFFYEDGLCGFGAMSEEPFFYFFVDEHKIVTVRVEAGLKEQVERLMAAFDLEQNEDAAGVDAAAHEHRSVLVAPEDDPRMLGFDEVVERLRDDWRLVLNINPETNVDDEDRDLGPTGWWCRVRVEVPVKAEQAPEGGVEPETLAETRYVEVVLVAECLREAEEEAILAAEKHAGLPSSALKVESLDEDEEDGLVPPFVVFADRMSEDQLETQRKSAPKRKGPATGPGMIISVKWAD